MDMENAMQRSNNTDNDMQQLKRKLGKWHASIRREHSQWQEALKQNKKAESPHNVKKLSL